MSQSSPSCLRIDTFLSSALTKAHASGKYLIAIALLLRDLDLES